MKVHKESVPFIGHVLTSPGRKPSSKKVDTILQMPQPTDVNGVRRLLGMVSYLSDIFEPLCVLTQKNVVWHWDQPQEEAFTKLKERISQHSVLHYYDAKKPIVYSVMPLRKE